MQTGACTGGDPTVRMATLLEITLTFADRYFLAAKANTGPIWPQETELGAKIGMSPTARLCWSMHGYARGAGKP
jgi:hypothetical protein